MHVCMLGTDTFYSINRQLEKEENLESSDVGEWFPSILSNYETYVMHAYAIEESTVNQSEYLKDYLKQDLHVSWLVV
jgi:hypothetical protein